MAKTLQIPVKPEQQDWINKGKKEMKIKTDAEFVRTLISYCMESDLSELRARMEKNRLTTMLQEAEATAKEALHKKEQLEKQLEKIGA